MATISKRKVDYEQRSFKETWTQDYFFIMLKDKAVCLICQASVAVFKEYNVKRHYETNHKSYKKILGAIRTEKIRILKETMSNQQKSLNQLFCQGNAASVRASYKAAEMIARAGKPFTDGEFLKSCIEVIMNEICPEQNKFLHEVCLSARTITRRIEDIGNNLYEQLKERARDFTQYSLALDESSDVKDTAQLLIFIRGISPEFVVTEELAALCSLKGTTTSKDIMGNVETVIQNLGLDWKKMKSITTDGARNMAGKKSGLVALISQKIKEAGGNAPIALHCIIHQQVLCMKVLRWSAVMEVVVSSVNFIRSHSRIHRQDFLTEVEALHSDVLYHTDVRWLSKGKVLERFFNLKTEIYEFMSAKGKMVKELLDPDWILELAFFIDVSSLMNELNLKLQGREKLVHQAFFEIKAFQKKLSLLSCNISERKMHNLPFCKLAFETEEKLEWPTTKFLKNIELLKTEFSDRFADFYAHSDEISVFQNPFACKIETAPEDLQMELIDLQSNDLLKNSFEIIGQTKFYSALSNSAFPKLKQLSASMITLFSSTYICEQTFSRMKFIKSKYRSQMSDEHLHSTLRISTSKFETDY